MMAFEYEDDLLDGLNALSAEADKKPSAAAQKSPTPAPAPAQVEPKAKVGPQKPPKTPVVPMEKKQGVASETPPKPKPLSANYSLYFLIFSAYGLVIFALGAGFGAMVSAGKFPAWDAHSGFLHALAAWVMAPAGILLIPIVALAFALAGLELREEKRHAGIFFGISGFLLILTGLIFFL